MQISVVVNTLNRVESLAVTLAALEVQTYPDFEVVVVNGPSTDGTEELLARYADRIRVASTDVPNLSVSRNVGIDAAAGELVAFIDDDAIPFPSWLAELAEPFADPSVVGTGGLVYGPDGRNLQHRFALCDRVGRTSFPDEAPGVEATAVGADPFLYLQGTNMCFRRSALEAVDGFDEEIEYKYDEVELAARLIDAGGRLVALDGAAVVHNYLESDVRDADAEVKNPFPLIKNRYYFAFKLGRPAGHAVGEIGEAVDEFVRGLETYYGERVGAGLMTPSAAERLSEIGTEAAYVGVAAGLRGRDDGRSIVARPASSFARFLPHEPPPAPRFVFVSSGYPPESFGGVVRFTHDLARGFAARGCEVHVVTSVMTKPSTDFREGVWVHQVQEERVAGPLVGRSGADILRRAFVVATAVDEIERRFGPVLLVSAPLWGAEGLVLSLDRSRPTVTTLMTTMRTISGMHEEWESETVADHLALEDVALRTSQHLHAISNAILEGVRDEFGGDVPSLPATVAHLGVTDHRDPAAVDARAKRSTVRILFVGRLEHRKGVDLLLAAAGELDARGLDFELVLVGMDTPNTGIGTTYRKAFLASSTTSASLRSKVTFAGEVDEDELYEAYGAADIFCGPSRYESLGLTHLEAAMMGLPVVGCAVGGLREVVAHNETGVLVPVDDASALADALAALITDGDRRRALGEAGRRAFEEHWNVDAAVTRCLELYTRIGEDAAARGLEQDRQQWSAALAEQLEGALDLPAGDAEALADEGLGLAPTGVPSMVTRAWEEGAHALVLASFRSMYGHSSNSYAIDAWLRWIVDERLPFGEIVNGIAAQRASGEPRPVWLAGILGYPGWDTPTAVTSAFRQQDDARWAAEIADLWRGIECPSEQREELGVTLLRALEATGGNRREALRMQDETDANGRRLHDWAVEALDGVPPEVSAEPEAEPAQAPGPPPAPETPPAHRRIRSKLGVAARAAPTLYRRVGVTAATVGQLERRAAESGEVPAAVARVETNVEGLPAILGALQGTVSAVAREVSELSQRLTASQEAQTQALEATRELRDRVSGVVGSLGVLHSKHVALAMDVREMRAAEGGEARKVEPEILDQAQVDRRPLRVNVGAGEKPQADYVNVDMRRLPGVAIVADAGSLPLEDGSVDEIFSSHLVEHFREHELRRTILPHWQAKLVPGGLLRIICPDWEDMVERRQRDEMSWADFKTVTFGQQDYEGDDHFAMYSPATLLALLDEVGFVDAEAVVTRRRNGLSSEMELIARRAPQTNG